MNDKPTPPHVFANHVLKQMIGHSFGDDLVIEYDDYHALRVAFRSMGGLWTEIGAGNIVHLTLLAKIVTAWGQMPERENTSDQVI
jgi:hypothetical protein